MNFKFTKKILLIIILIVILIVVIILKFSNEDGWNCVSGEWVQHGNPSGPMPNSGCFNNNELSQQKVEKYLAENISVISPIKEVLGGKFYITKIIFEKDNFGTVEYEDGHIALVATFGFFFSDGGEVNIKDFKIIKE